jgi:hypothetical protein
MKDPPLFKLTAVRRVSKACTGYPIDISLKRVHRGRSHRLFTESQVQEVDPLSSNCVSVEIRGSDEVATSQRERIW